MEYYAELLLKNQSYAILASELQEVVEVREPFARVPMAPNFVKGVFNLRGQSITVIDLSSLFGFSEEETSVKVQKIAIIRDESFIVGLLFDDVGDIFRTDQAQAVKGNAPDLPTLLEGTIIRHERIVQLLSVPSILKLDFPKTTLQATEKRRRSLLRDRRLLTFEIDEGMYALDLLSVVAVMMPTQKSEMDALPVVYHMNRRIAVVNLTKKATGDERVLIIRMNETAVGIVVSRVASIIAYSEDEIRSGHGVADCLVGTYQLGEKSVAVLDPHRLDQNYPQMDLAKTFYESANHTVGHDEHQELERSRTLIPFLIVRIGMEVAIPVSQLSGVLDVPPSLLKPPGLHPSILGLLHLQNQSIPVACSQSIYRLGTESPKIVLFYDGDKKVGLSVESIDGVVTGKLDKASLPKKNLFRDESVAKDCDQLMVSSSEGKAKTLYVLNLDRAAQHLRAI